MPTRPCAPDLTAPSPAPPAPAPQLQRAIADACQRGYEGAGTPGTRYVAAVPAFRFFGALYLAAAFGYAAWRAARTLGEGWQLAVTGPFWVGEALSLLLGGIFVLGLWHMVERPGRRLSAMLPEKDFPLVDVLVVCYTEPLEVRRRCWLLLAQCGGGWLQRWRSAVRLPKRVRAALPCPALRCTARPTPPRPAPQVIEPTLIAALNLDYPGSRLCVHLLDDGRREEVAAMAARLQQQLR